MKFREVGIWREGEEGRGEVGSRSGGEGANWEGWSGGCWVGSWSSFPSSSMTSLLPPSLFIGMGSYSCLGCVGWIGFGGDVQWFILPLWILIPRERRSGREAQWPLPTWPLPPPTFKRAGTRNQAHLHTPLSHIRAGGAGGKWERGDRWQLPGTEETPHTLLNILS